VVARRQDRLDTLVAEIRRHRLAVSADISDRNKAEHAVAKTIEHFGRPDILVNNAGLMLLGSVVGAMSMSGTA